MFRVLYLGFLSAIIISLLHCIYNGLYEKEPDRERVEDDYDDEAMREELTAYVESLMK